MRLLVYYIVCVCMDCYNVGIYIVSGAHVCTVADSLFFMLYEP